ncbi:MAG: hypothetical protein U1E35_06540 [Rhodospirillales bacterium]
MDIDRHAEAAALDLAAPHRRQRLPRTKQETMSVPPEIEASRTVGLDRPVDVIEPFRRQRAGGEDHPQRCERVGVDGLEPHLRQRLDELRRGAEVGRPFRLDVVEQHRPRRASGRRRRAAASPPDARPETSQFHIIQPQVV